MKPEEAIPLLQRGLVGEIYDEKGYLTALGYEALDVIDSSKCSTLVPKQHGEWIKITKVTPNFLAYKCSICGNVDYLHNRRYENSCKYVLGRYCWACGSLMKEEGEEK